MREGTAGFNDQSVFVPTSEYVRVNYRQLKQPAC
jgi:hypothetical protein